MGWIIVMFIIVVAFLAFAGGSGGYRYKNYSHGYQSGSNNRKSSRYTGRYTGKYTGKYRNRY